MDIDLFLLVSLSNQPKMGQLQKRRTHVRLLSYMHKENQ